MNLQPAGDISAKSRQLCWWQSYSSVLYSSALGEQMSEAKSANLINFLGSLTRERERERERPVLSLLSHHVEPGGTSPAMPPSLLSAD